MMSPFSMLGRGLGGLPLMGPLEGRIEDTFRLVSPNPIAYGERPMCIIIHQYLYYA
jgi:hypothetical protein